MFKEFVRDPAGQALVSDQAAARLAPPGFDPSRVTQEDFSAWVSRQPSDREYSYCSNTECAFAQYLTHKGVSEPRVTPSYWRNGLDDDERYPLSDRLNDALVDEPNTFGALAQRLAEYA